MLQVPTPLVFHGCLRAIIMYRAVYMVFTPPLHMDNLRAQVIMGAFGVNPQAMISFASRKILVSIPGGMNGLMSQIGGSQVCMKHIVSDV